GEGRAKKARLRLLPDFSHELDQGMAEKRLDLALEVGAIDGVDLGGDLEGQTHALGESNGQVGTLLRRDATEEGQVFSAARRERIVGQGQAMVDGRRPGDAQPLQGQALGMADRYERLVAKVAEHRVDAGQIEAAMEGVQAGASREPSEGKSQVADMGVDDVKVPRALEDLGHFHDVRGELVVDGGIEAQGVRRGRHQRGPRARISAGKEGDLMSAPDELLGEIGDDALGASVERRGHTLVKRRDLRDAERANHEPPSDACEQTLWRKSSHEEDVEESGPSSARVRITAVSLGQSLSAVGGMLAFRARTGPVTPSNPSVTTCSPIFSRRMAGGSSCSTTSTHHFSSISEYLIPHSPMRHRPSAGSRLPVVRPPVIVVQARLVFAGDRGIGII